MIALAGLLAVALAGYAPVAHPPVAANAATARSRACDDFLAQTHLKPPHAIYGGCRCLPDRQGKPLRALYHLSGRFAARTEAYLVKAVGLEPLRRSCCQWDTPARQFRDAMGRELSITMVSDQTGASNRRAWTRIARFEISVEILTEDI